MLQFLDCKWTRGPAVNIRSSVTDELHPALRKEVMAEICHKLISQARLFYDVEDRLVLYRG